MSQTLIENTQALAAKLGIDARTLLGCIWFESKGNPAARNPLSNASGLIQFMPKLLVQWGYDPAAVRAMSVDEQWPLVERYFAPFIGKLKTSTDVYMAILWPAAVGHGDGYPLFDEGTLSYLQNKGLDINHDGKVTAGEAFNLVKRSMLQPGFVELAAGLGQSENGFKPFGGGSNVGIAFAGVAVGVAAFFGYEALQKKRGHR